MHLTLLHTARVGFLKASSKLSPHLMEFNRLASVTTLEFNRLASVTTFDFQVQQYTTLT